MLYKAEKSLNDEKIAIRFEFRRNLVEALDTGKRRALSEIIKHGVNFIGISLNKSFHMPRFKIFCVAGHGGKQRAFFKSPETEANSGYSSAYVDKISGFFLP